LQGRVLKRKKKPTTTYYPPPQNYCFLLFFFGIYKIYIYIKDLLKRKERLQLEKGSRAQKPAAPSHKSYKDNIKQCKDKDSI
jgi:hypothetical protein